MWGQNYDGQLGDGTTTSRNVPTEITSRFSLNSSDKITSLSLGSSHSSALSATGRVFMWGSNWAGQLGDGTTTKRNVPTEISSEFSFAAGDKITSLSLDSSHSSALSATGRVFMWGSNFSGQLGDGTTTSRIVPSEIQAN
jgi:alpha-tubulin suppressor-like RCC1 family protein